MDFFRNRAVAIGKVPSHRIPRYIQWVTRCYAFCRQAEGAPLNSHQVAEFIAHLSTRLDGPQLAHACKAIALYRTRYSLIQAREIRTEKQWHPLLIRFRHVARLRALPTETADTYTEQIRLFLEYWKAVSADTLCERHAMLYLSHQAGNEAWSNDQRNQVFAGLSLFYQFVLGKELRHFITKSAGWYHGTERRKVS